MIEAYEALLAPGDGRIRNAIREAFIIARRGSTTRHPTSSSGDDERCLEGAMEHFTAGEGSEVVHGFEGVRGKIFRSS